MIYVGWLFWSPLCYKVFMQVTGAGIAHLGKFWGKNGGLICSNESSGAKPKDNKTQRMNVQKA